MKPFAFRGHIDARCQWEAHELSHESNSERVERLLRRLKIETPELDIPIEENPPRTETDFSKGSELNIDVKPPELITFIESKREEWGYNHTATAFKRLLIQACSLPPDRNVSPEEAIISFNVSSIVSRLSTRIKRMTDPKSSICPVAPQVPATRSID